MFKVRRTESRQFHQKWELLHIAFHPRQAFHDIRCQGGRQDACEIEDEQRQSLQVENPAYGAIRNDGGDNQRIHRQRAEQVSNGATAMVTRRSRGSLMVRADITAGTAQAKLDKRGINERPDKPLFAMMLSSRKAARGR